MRGNFCLRCSIFVCSMKDVSLDDDDDDDEISSADAMMYVCVCRSVLCRWFGQLAEHSTYAMR